MVGDGGAADAPCGRHVDCTKQLCSRLGPRARTETPNGADSGNDRQDNLGKRVLGAPSLFVT